MPQTVGIIGGSGLYDLPGLQDVREERAETPFGPPSDALIQGRLAETSLWFLPRHGRGHRHSPSDVPYRANLYALKERGCDWVISVSAVGSLVEQAAPGDVVMIDQFIDRTRRPQASSFFGNGVVAHVPFGDPVCETLRGYLRDAANEAGARTHDGGTYVNMEGPAFSTRAESNLYRSWGATVVGMTNLPEAKLAREAGMSYATLAMVTDYDCWHPDHDNVDVEQIIATLMANVDLSRRIVAAAIPRIAAHQGPAPQATALHGAVITQPDAMDPKTRQDLWLLIREAMG